MTIAIIDDDIVHQFIMRKMISSYKPTADVVVFDDGQQAADHITLCKLETQLLPNIIFLDINMPHLDGWGFLEALRDMHLVDYSPTIYMVSSSPDSDDRMKTVAYPELSNFFCKPMSRGLLTTILDQHV